MNLLTILYWTILVLATIAYLSFSWVYTIPAALLALLVINGIRSFRTSIS